MGRTPGRGSVPSFEKLGQENVSYTMIFDQALTERHKRKKIHQNGLEQNPFMFERIFLEKPRNHNGNMDVAHRPKTRMQERNFLDLSNGTRNHKLAFVPIYDDWNEYDSPAGHYNESPKRRRKTSLKSKIRACLCLES